MSVSIESNKVTYQGNDSITTFAITFEIKEASKASTEIEVYLRDETDPDNPIETLQVLTTNYTLTGGSPPTDVEMNVAPTSDEKLIIRRILPETQTVEYSPSGPFPNADHELAMDRIVLQIQQLMEQITRTPVLDITSQFLNKLIPEPQADQMLAINAGKTGWEFKSADDILNLTGALAIANNLSDVADKPASLSNIMVTTESDIDNNISVAKDIAGFTLDPTKYSSGMFLVEIDRNTFTNFTFANGIIYLQHTQGVWRLEKSTFHGDISGSNFEPGGVIFSVVEPGGIPQVQYETDNMSGVGYEGKIIFKQILFAL
jgi:hypothetical protein